MSTAETGPSQVRIATYNFENMGSGKTPEAMENLASTLKTLDADVVAFEEVRSQAALDEFTSTYKLDADYPYKAVFQVAKSGQNVGFMSRFPISHKESNYSKGPFMRDLGEVQIDIPNYPLRMYVGHLKADPFFMGHPKPEEFQRARDKRMAEVKGIQKVLQGDMASIPGRRYIVCGDLNVQPDSPEMKALRDASSPTPLMDPLADQNGPETISHPPTGRRYDYLMLSPEVADDVVAGSVGVYRDNPVAEKASDHLPVVLTLDTSKA